MDIGKIRAAIEALQAQLKQHEDAPSPTVAELWEKYAVWGAGARKSWKGSQAVHWAHLAPALGAARAADITFAMTDAYRAARTAEGCSPATRNREMSSLRACFSWAVKRRLLAHNPLAGMEQERERNVRTEFIDETAFAALCSAAPNPLARALFILGFDAGMRRGEMLDLLWEAVDLDAHLIRMGDGDVKNGEGRIVPLTDRVCAALRELPRWSRFVFSADGGPVGKSTANDWFRAARARAELRPALKLHGLRHSCATLMRRRGVPWPLIKAALGWKTDVAARRYQQYNADDWTQLREKMNEGICAETRKPPLRSVGKTESAHTVPNKAQALNEK